jgi:hypothetical protein
MLLVHVSGALNIRDEIYIDALQNAQWFLRYQREGSAHHSWLQSETELLIVASILNIEELPICLSAPQRVFKLWYLAKHQGALSKQAAKTREALAAAFPQLPELSESQQRIAGTRRIEMEERESGRATNEP